MDEEKIIDINAGQKPDDLYVQGGVNYDRDYEGGTVLVDWDRGLFHTNGKLNKRMVKAVQMLIRQHAEVVISAPSSVNSEDYDMFCTTHFGQRVGRMSMCEYVEHWGSRCVQTTDAGLRVDGANENAVQVVAIIAKDEQGLILDTRPPKVTTSDEQVVSLGIYFYRAVMQAFEAISKGGQKQEIPKDQVDGKKKKSGFFRRKKKGSK